MIRFARPHPSRTRLFGNTWLERTTLTPFPLFLLVWAAALALVAFEAARLVTPGQIAIFTPLALLGWTLFEYVAHRYLFHLELKSAWGMRLIFLLHENHHADPADPLRSVMPFSVSLPLGAAIWGLLVWVFGVIGHVLFLGFGLGYVMYDTVHWACHQRPMRGTLLGRLKRHHLRHHHAGQQANYAITAIFWDRLFGSQLEKRKP